MKTFVHPDFDVETIDSDIALVKLRHPVPLGRYVGVACLPSTPRPSMQAPPTASSTVPPKRTLFSAVMPIACYALGWGKTADRHLFGADTLREIRVPLIPDRICRSSFEFDLTQSQFCAGYATGGVDTCAGDSGGPLMCEMFRPTETGSASNHTHRHSTTSRGAWSSRVGEAGRQWYVHGVTSFGEGCGVRGKYGIYTRVDKFVDWIDDVISNN